MRRLNESQRFGVAAEEGELLELPEGCRRVGLQRSFQTPGPSGDRDSARISLHGTRGSIPMHLWINSLGAVH
jgi:hypothetical protein